MFRRAAAAGANNERNATRTGPTCYPPPTLFRLHCTSLHLTAIASNQDCGVFASHNAATMLRNSHACRCPRNLFLSTCKTPLQPSHILPQKSACGGSCAVRPGIRHEDELVCSLGYATRMGNRT